MSIKEILRKLFRKNKFTQEIINIKDLVKIPTREDVSNDKNKLELIDKYKEKYLDILSSKRILTSIDLSLDNIQEDIKMNIELLLNLCMKKDYQNSLQERLSKTQSELMIEILKLKSYQEDISKLETETITRLIALNEIMDKKKYYLFPSKKSSIANEINNLSMTLFMFTNQKVAIQKEINTYFNDIETTGILNKINDIVREDKEILENKRNLLLKYLNEVIPHKEITNNNLDIKTEIVLLERKLEIYVYKNKKEIDNLKEELSKLSKEEKIKENRDRLIEKINKLELKYRVFNEYGRGLLTKEDLYELYKVKFDILTIDINNIRKPIIDDNTNFHELECYKDIISKKIELILKGENKIVQAIFCHRFSEITISMIKEFLMNTERQLDFGMILSNPLKLNFLLSLNTNDGFKNFINNFELPLNECYLNEKIYKFKDNLSVHSVFKLFDFGLVKGNEKIPIVQLYNLYKISLYSSTNEKNEYFFPEDIIEINVSEINKEQLKQIVNKASQKVVKMPSSLKKINGPLFNDLTVDKVILNEKLEEIDDSFLEGFKSLNSINFPPGLKLKINKNKTDLPILYERKKSKSPKIKRITFDDWENSIIFNDIDELKKFIMTFFYTEYYDCHVHKGRKVRAEFNELFLNNNDIQIIIAVYDDCDVFMDSVFHPDSNFYEKDIVSAAIDSFKDLETNTFYKTIDDLYFKDDDLFFETDTFSKYYVKEEAIKIVLEKFLEIFDKVEKKKKYKKK